MLCVGLPVTSRHAPAGCGELEAASRCWFGDQMSIRTRMPLLLPRSRGDGQVARVGAGAVDSPRAPSHLLQLGRRPSLCVQRWFAASRPRGLPGRQWAQLGLGAGGDPSPNQLFVQPARLHEGSLDHRWRRSLARASRSGRTVARDRTGSVLPWYSRGQMVATSSDSGVEGPCGVQRNASVRLVKINGS